MTSRYFRVSGLRHVRCKDNLRVSDLSDRAKQGVRVLFRDDQHRVVLWLHPYRTGGNCSEAESAYNFYQAHRLPSFRPFWYPTYMW